MYIFLNLIDKKCPGIKYLVLDMSPFKKDFYKGHCFSKVLKWVSWINELVNLKSKYLSKGENLVDNGHGTEQVDF